MSATILQPGAAAHIAAATPIEGAILAKWNSLGGAGGLLGAAQTGDTVCPDGVGHFVRFAGGSIYWMPQTGAFSVHGSIRDKWASLGGERGSLGYPTSDEGDLAGGGRVSTFQHGRICWTVAKGAWLETGAPAVAQLDFNFSPIVTRPVNSFDNEELWKFFFKSVRGRSRLRRD